jgi:hypothetical protein
MFKMFNNNKISMSLARNTGDASHKFSAKVIVRINGTIPDVSTLGDEKNLKEQRRWNRDR